MNFPLFYIYQGLAHIYIALENTTINTAIIIRYDMMTYKTPKSIAIVGGGTAGLVTALILKTRLPNLKIDLICSSKIGIIGVGEGSTEHWIEFMKHINVNHHDIIKECDATYKSGIMFKGWAEQDYLHNIADELNLKSGYYPFFYSRQIAYEASPKDLVLPRNWDSHVNTWFIDKPYNSPVNQYHFNTNKLNNFLTKRAELLGINVIDDEISDATITATGDIGTLIGEKSNYEYDFYIDSTGFKKLLISKLGAKWQSYSKYLKMKSAIVFPTGDRDEYNMWTVSQAMDYGWMFTIPVWGRHGNGYIFDSDYITAEQAKEEVEQFLGYEINVGKQLNFDPGALDNVWINNCCAVGLSASFVEPLEASSIGSSIQQAFLLMHKISNYNDSVIKQYNTSITSILENIRDFIALHYITKKENSRFWKDVQRIELPDSLKEKLELWKYKLPIAEDFSNGSKFQMFTEAHHILVMNGLGLFDSTAIQAEYEQLDLVIQAHADAIIVEQTEFLNSTKSLPHKHMISAIRNLK